MSEESERPDQPRQDWTPAYPSPPPGWQSGHEPPKKSHRGAALIAAFGVVVAVGAGYGIYTAVKGPQNAAAAVVHHKPKPKPKPVHVGPYYNTVQVEVTDDTEATCAFNSRATTLLKDQSGVLLGAGQIGKGVADGKGGCIYKSKIGHIPDNAKQYLFTTDAFGGTVTYSRAQLGESGWVLGVKIYNQN